MDKRYSCYCGLYCENCNVKVKVLPAAKALYFAMSETDFGSVAVSLPNGKEFWAFLKDVAENWACVSCRDGSGNPGCKVRVCAEGKGVEMCAFCNEYPCELIKGFKEGYPGLEDDNALLRDEGWEAWGRLQDERAEKRGR